jgi:transcriptional regulator with XRE-family HTH domain
MGGSLHFGGASNKKFNLLISLLFRTLPSIQSSVKANFFETPVMFLDMPRGRPSSIPRTAFGRRLVQAREQAGFTQSELAQKLGILQRTVAYWERLPYSLRPDQIAQIAEVLTCIFHKFSCDAISHSFFGCDHCKSVRITVSLPPHTLGASQCTYNALHRGIF